MAYVLDPTRPLGDEVRRVGVERLDRAIELLSGMETADPDEVAHAVHGTRKRCKEVRALALLVGPALRPEHQTFEREVRDVARELGTIRDAQALLTTFDRLRKLRGADHDQDLDQIRAEQVSTIDRATIELRTDVSRIDRTRSRLEQLRTDVETWDLGSDFDTIGIGLQQVYARGRDDMRRAVASPTDRRMHRWRASGKQLCAAIRLLEPASPSVLGPLLTQLEDLSEALGDDHDLAVLVARITSDPARYGGRGATRTAVRLARTQQEDLRARATRLGATIYAERPKPFRKRVERYWCQVLELGPEVPVGGLADLLADQFGADAGRPRGTWIERERKFIVTELPSLPVQGSELRQGYLAVDGQVSVRVREAGGEGCTLTVKAGRGPVRTEFEWRIDPDQFDLAWNQTRGRRIHKTRYRLPWNGHVVELDVFHDELGGLVLAEVEFGSESAMNAFSPPPWFGLEVTDDSRFSNAELADSVPGLTGSRHVRP